MGPLEVTSVKAHKLCLCPHQGSQPKADGPRAQNLDLDVRSVLFPAYRQAGIHCQPQAGQPMAEIISGSPSRNRTHILSLGRICSIH